MSSGTSTATVGALAGAGVLLVASPYLARLTLSVPDRENAQWWRGAAVSSRRWTVTAVIAVVLGALAGRAAGWSAVLVPVAAIAVVTTPLVVIDYELHRLPDRLTATLAVAGAVLFAVPAATRHDWHSYVRALSGGLAAYIVLWIIGFAAPRSFGGGDVKLGAGIGMLLGWFGWMHVYYGIFAGFVLGSVVGLAMIASRNGTLKSHVAFGPMLILGPFVVLAFHLVPHFGN